MRRLTSTLSLAAYLIYFLFLFSLGESYADDWQRVYLATFPRSGNHWMRYLIEEATHIATSSVYRDPDRPHLPKTFPWKGYCVNHGYAGQCRYPEKGEIVVVKTHFPHLFAENGDELDFIKAIHIVRHPVDSLYSLYLHSQNGRPISSTMPRATLMGFIHSLREFEEYWASKENVLTLRYEDLQNDPYAIFKQVLEFIGYQVGDEHILRAIAKYPPQGSMLKHCCKYPENDLKYIVDELKDFMQKYDYHIPGIN